MCEFPILEWAGHGYDIFIEPSAERNKGTYGEQWMFLQSVIANARKGDFRLVAELPDLAAKTQDLALQEMACEIIGDAGNAIALERLLGMLESDDFETGLSAVSGLVSRGRLLDVPAVFYFYELNQNVKDAEIIRYWLDWWLCAPEESFVEPGVDPVLDPTWKDYRKQVGQRYFDLWNELGTNLVHICRGRVFDIERIAKQMLSNARVGRLRHGDRHVFEATTGISCSGWYREDGGFNALRAAADLESFLQSYKATCAPGQRAFMGYPLENVSAAAEVLKKYPPNNGLGAPYVRTTFNVDEVFELEYGISWLERGYFYPSPKPPPDATIPPDNTMPWLAFQISLREARQGNRQPLQKLASFLKPGLEGIVSETIADLLGDAADRNVISDWRDKLLNTGDAEFVLDLCDGLLWRGVLSDVPFVLAAYRKVKEHPYAYYLQQLLNDLFAFEPIVRGFEPRADVDSFCNDMTRRYQQLRDEFGTEDVPVFRGQIFSPQQVAQEVIERKHGSFLLDLRRRFERSTGIDCSSWFMPKGGDFEDFDYTAAETVARNFLNSPGAHAYQPGKLYFFGSAIEL
jgi:hypothetical protein